MDHPSMCTAHRVAKEHMCLQAGRVDDGIGKPWLSIPTTSAHHERSMRGCTEWCSVQPAQATHGGNGDAVD